MMDRHRQKRLADRKVELEDVLNTAIKHTEQSIFTRFAKADFAMFDATENAKVTFFGKCQRKAVKPRHWQLFIYLYVPRGEAVDVALLVCEADDGKKCRPTQLSESIKIKVNDWLSENQCGYLKCTVVCRIK